VKSIPLPVSTVPFGKTVLVFKKTKTFQIKEDGGFYVIRCKSLGIDVYSKKLFNLREELYEAIRSNWREYALADDSELSPKAILLKRTLLKTIEERRPVEDLYDSLSTLVSDAFCEAKDSDLSWKSSVAYKRLKEIKKSLKSKE